MDTDHSQGKSLLEVMAKIRRVTAKNPFNQTLPHRDYYVLYLLHRCKRKQIHNTTSETPLGLKVSELSAKINITTPSVSQMINALEEKGYVERVTTRNDRRVVYICITQHGEDMLEITNRQFYEITDEIVERLGQEDTETLIRLCNRTHDIIRDIQQKHAMKEN